VLIAANNFARSLSTAAAVAPELTISGAPLVIEAGDTSSTAAIDGLRNASFDELGNRVHHVAAYQRLDVGIGFSATSPRPAIFAVGN
jgi:hypothetical protein